MTQFDYEYLKGNEDFWSVRGAAFNVVHDWCKKRDYGYFGKPTKRGRDAMYVYEQQVSGQ